MLSILLLFVGLASAQSQNSFVAVEWTTQEDGTIDLVPQQREDYVSQPVHVFGDRYPAGQDLPQYTPPKVYRPKPVIAPPSSGKYSGLGKYSCIKQGYLNAGEGDVSNKFIAMIAVRAKDRNDSMGLTGAAADRAAMREAIYSASAIGSCKGSNYRFTPEEAARSEQWLNAPKINVSKHEYRAVFQMDQSRVNKAINDYDATPGRVQRNWDYWNEGTPAHGCAKQLPKRSRIRLCQIVGRACGVPEVGCNRGNRENPKREGGDGNNNNNNGGKTDGGTTGGNTGGTTGGDTGGNTGGDTGGNTGGDTGGNTGGDTGGNTGGDDGGNDNGSDTGRNSESGDGRNSDSHGGDRSGGHGDGPGNT